MMRDLGNMVTWMQAQKLTHPTATQQSSHWESGWWRVEGMPKAECSPLVSKALFPSSPAWSKHGAGCGEEKSGTERVVGLLQWTWRAHYLGVVTKEWQPHCHTKLHPLPKAGLARGRPGQKAFLPEPHLGLDIVLEFGFPTILKPHHYK